MSLLRDSRATRGIAGTTRLSCLASEGLRARPESSPYSLGMRANPHLARDKIISSGPSSDAQRPTHDFLSSFQSPLKPPFASGTSKRSVLPSDCAFSIFIGAPAFFLELCD